MQIEVQHADHPKEIYHLNKEIVIIGRSTKCDLRLTHAGISREHMQVELKHGEIYITDLDSTNGVFIDGQRIQSRMPVLYQTYLSLVIGQTTLQVTPPADATASFNILTKVMQAPPKMQKPPMGSAHSPVILRSKTKNSYTLGAIGLIILAGAVYLTMNGSEKVKPVAAPSPAPQAKASPLQVAFDRPDDYLQVWKEGGCKSREEQIICKKFKPSWFKNEHLIIREKIYIYINLSKELQYRGYKVEKMQDVAEILMANYSTHPLIRELNRPTFAIGFIEVDDRTEIKYLLSQNMSEVPILDESLHRSVFSRALVGEVWLFSKVIRPYITFKKL